MGVSAPALTPACRDVRTLAKSALTPTLSRRRERGHMRCDVWGAAKSALTPALSRARERGNVGYC